MREHDVAPRGALPLFGDGTLRLGEKGVDALHARHSRLDGLDLHAQAFDGGEDAGDVVDHATEVPTDMPNSVSTAALPEADSSMTAPTTTAFSTSTTGE